MSVLQFIAALKWPLFLLIVFSFVWWRTRRNPALGQTTRQLIEARNIRMNVGGQELELTRVEEAAAIAASSDETIAAAAQAEGAADQPDDPDVLSIRREAVEQLMISAIQWGYASAQIDPRTTPNPVISWPDDGTPVIRSRSTTEASRARQAAVRRRLWNSMGERSDSSPGTPL
ncbi:hypothetical protein [Streptomyces sp. NPDC056405]|uniref:hypothetical protein n=1 Tax=Streptomyces sp. NPDC056405 TaxID=3345811 RepID=UPI0035DA5B79